MKEAAALTLVVGVCLLLPALASAHVGRGPVVAVNEQAKVTGIEPRRPPFAVKVVDGDQSLWLRLQPGHELVVLGVIGDRFLRFSDAGVFVNLRSPTAQIDKIGGTAVRPVFAGVVPTSWKRVAVGRSYRWHDHRLHALASLGGSGSARVLGPWVVPLRVDGKQGAIRGVLRYRPAPDLWLWLALPVLMLAAALAVVRSGDDERIVRASRWSAAIAVVAVVAARAGREFYGRPTPALVGYVSFGLGVGIAAWALYRLLWRPTEYTPLVTLVVGIVAAVEAATLLAMLYRPYVLSVLPPSVERSCVAVAFGGAIAATLLCLVVGLGDANERESPTEVRAVSTWIEDAARR